MVAGCVNDGMELITDRRNYDAYIRIYQNILTTLRGKLSQAQVTIRLISPSCSVICILWWWNIGMCRVSQQLIRALLRHVFNLLAPELIFLILAHPVYKM